MHYNNTSNTEIDSSRKNYLESMHYDFWHYRHFIRTTQSSKYLRRILNAITMYNYSDYTSKKINRILKNLKGKVQALNMRDYTRNEFCKDLDKMVNALEDAIRKENPAWEIPSNYLY